MQPRLAACAGSKNGETEGEDALGEGMNAGVTVSGADDCFQLWRRAMWWRTAWSEQLSAGATSAV
jgi:hypothetical protein